MQYLYAGSVALDVRTRSAVPGDAPNATTAADGEVNPRVAGSVLGAHDRFDLAYAPTFRWREPYSPSTWRYEHTQRGTLFYEHRFDATTRGYASAFGSYGLTDLSTLRLSAPTAAAGTPEPTVIAPIQPVTSAAVIREGDFDFALGSDVQLSASASVGASIGWFLGGGVDDAARASLPWQNAPRAEGRFRFSPTATDALTMLLVPRYARFSTGAAVASFEFSEAWRHDFDPRTFTEVSGGIAGAGGQPTAGSPRTFGVLPMVGLAASHTFAFPGHSLEARAQGTLGPFIDRFSGSIYERIEGGAALAWVYRQTLRASVRYGVAQSLGVLGGNLFTTALDGSVGYEGSRFWRADVSLRRSSTYAPPPPMATVSGLNVQWLFQVSFTVRTEGVL